MHECASRPDCAESPPLNGGVSLNHMYWPACRHESLNVEAVYRFHPRFREADFKI
jgi:arginine deiminase